MSRYIDADAIYRSLGMSERDVEIAHMIEEAPSINIVRCNECKHCFICGYRHGMNVYECRISHMRMYDTSNHFCSYGERKENE